MRTLEIDGRYQIKRQCLTIYNVVAADIVRLTRFCLLSTSHLAFFHILFVNVSARITMTYAHSGLPSENAKREYRLFEISFYSTSTT